MIRLVSTFLLLVVALLATGCPENPPKGLTWDCKECVMTQENKNSCFERCAGVDAHGRRANQPMQPESQSVHRAGSQYLQNSQTRASPGTWEQYVYNNLDPESIQRYLNYKNFITFARERCGSNLGSHTPFNSKTSAVKIAVCSGWSEVETGITIAHELVHVQSMISTGGQWDHETTALAECRFIQRKHPGLLSTRYTMCNQSDDDILAYGRENGGTIAEREER